MEEYDVSASVETFIACYSLDERAADALRSCAPEVQQKVLDRGDLSDVRNPSSAVLGRIRDAQSGVVARGLTTAGPAIKETVEEFVLKFDLDERAAGALRECPDEVQQAVIDRGDLTDVRNPSSAVIGRIRDAQGGAPKAGAGGGCGGKGGPMGGWGGPAGFGGWGPYGPPFGFSPFGGDGGWGGPPFGGPGWAGGAARGGPVSPREMEEFIKSNNLDERAGDALRTCAPQVQRVVIDRGNLKDTRNPSSAVLGRIRDAQSDKSGGGMAGCGGGGDWDAGMAAWGAGPPQRSAPGGPVSPDEVEVFIMSNGLDERAADALRSCSANVQRIVIDRGDLKETRNPSSAVCGRIRDAQAGKSGGAPAAGGGDWAAAAGMAAAWGAGPPQRSAPGEPASPDEVEIFIMANGLDERAADALRSCSPNVQRIVIDRGDLKETRNPSSAVCGRIRDAQAGKSGGAPAAGGGDWAAAAGMAAAWGAGPPQRSAPGGPVSPDEVEVFIMSNGLDERAADALRTCAPNVQRIVIDRGDLKETRNPSSAVCGRIRDAQAGKSGGAPAAGGGGGADWAAAGPWGGPGGMPWGGGAGAWGPYGPPKGGFLDKTFAGKGPYGGGWGGGKGGW